MPGNPPIQIFQAMRRELRQYGARHRAPGAAKTMKQEIIERYGREHNIRYSSFRKWDRENFGADRGDAGVMRKLNAQPDWEQKIKDVFQILCEYSDFEAKRWAPTQYALDEAIRRGILAEGEICLRNLNNWIAKLRLRQGRGITHFQAAYSNQVHQCDVSGFKYLAPLEYQGDGEWTLEIKNLRTRQSKSKIAGLKEFYRAAEEVEDPRKPRLWLVGMVDDHSRAKIMQAVVAPGESAAMVRNFIHAAWRGELDPQSELKVKPEVLYMDNGPFARNEETENYLGAREGVGVTLQLHEPYRARSTGKMERSWGHLLRSFTVPFLATKPIWKLSEVNDALHQWCRAQNAKAHPFLQDQSRIEVYTTGLKQPQVIPPREALASAYKPFERTIDNAGLFTLTKITYQAPMELRGLKVLVFRNAFGQVSVYDKQTGAYAIVERWEGPLEFGTYRAHEESEMDRTAKRRDHKDVQEAQHPVQQSAGGALIVPFQPVEIQEAKPTPFTAAVRFSSTVEAKTAVMKMIAPEAGLTKFKNTYPELWAELSELLNRTLDKAEITQWATDINDRLSRVRGSGGVS